MPQRRSSPTTRPAVQQSRNATGWLSRWPGGAGALVRSVMCGRCGTNADSRALHLASRAVATGMLLASRVVCATALAGVTAAAARLGEAIRGRARLPVRASPKSGAGRPRRPGGVVQLSTVLLERDAQLAQRLVLDLANAPLSSRRSSARLARAWRPSAVPRRAPRQSRSARESLSARRRLRLATLSNRIVLSSCTVLPSAATRHFSTWSLFSSVGSNSVGKCPR